LRVEGDERQPGLGMAGRLRQAFRPGGKIDGERQARLRGAGNADNADATDLEQAGELGWRPGKPVLDFHPVVGDQGEAVIKKAEQQVGLARAGGPEQQYACATTGGTARMYLHGGAMWYGSGVKGSGMWPNDGHASVPCIGERGIGEPGVGQPAVLVGVDARGVAQVTLNRPARGNAYDGELLHQLAGGLEALGGRADVRAIVIRGAGKHFQAGADLDWLACMADAPEGEAYAASMATTRTMAVLNEFPKPTLAVIHGACFGGGCGLACSVDVALATPAAIFGLTEVRVGVAPTPIAAQMVQAMGLRHARRYALTGERFDAAEALRIDLVHEVVAEERLEARLGEILDAILLSAPGAIAVTKRAILAANDLLLEERTMAELAEAGRRQRASPEGREGLAAFREKRRPGWYSKS